MGFRCKHKFEYSQGRFQCSKCGKIASEKQFKRNHNKSYAMIVIMGLLIMGGIYAYGNYSTTLGNILPMMDNDQDILKDIRDLGEIDEKTYPEITENIPNISTPIPELTSEISKKHEENKDLIIEDAKKRAEIRKELKIEEAKQQAEIEEAKQQAEIIRAEDRAQKKIERELREEHFRKMKEEQRLSLENYIQDLPIEIHELINYERTSRGLPPLEWNPIIAQAALNHSTDMATREYFEHDSPEGHDFVWRYYQVGFNCSIVLPDNMILGGGENIMLFYGKSSSEDIAIETVQGWMNSPGHRVNVLRAHFLSEGIGVALSNSSYIYITQNFC